MNVTVINQLLPTSSSSFAPFAMTDVLTEVSSDTSQSFLHFWQLDQTLILGMKDTRVTNLKAGLKSVKEQGYHTLVRNSGGLGVIADEGILNISYIFQKNDSIHSTDEAYIHMYHFMQRAFPELLIEAYEISDSYCPGTFDLSVNNKKIAGIAQRRLKDGVAVMLYLSVNGDQDKRGKVVRSFYQDGLSEHFGQNGYPPVDPDSMTTISELLQKEVTIPSVVNRFLSLFDTYDELTNPMEWIISKDLKELFAKKEQNMIDRNEQIKELNYDYSL